MKKRSINKFMALVLGMSLTVTALAGCGQKKSSDSSQTASTQSGASESAVSEDSEEENAIKWSGTITVAPYMLGPIENDEITPLLEEKLLEYGYDVTLENVYIEDSQYKEILNLKLASGEAPDIFYCHGSVDILQQYLDQGLIATWDEEFFREHAPNVAAFIDAGEPDGANADVADVFWAMARFGGEEMCVLPTYAWSTGSPINVVYNKQWLDNLNAEVPETGRVLVVTPDTYLLMKQCKDITMETDIGNDLRLKGVISNLDGLNVIKVPKNRLAENFGFMIAHPCATVAPTKLESYKTHQDPPGISGELVEGRICYDAFVLENKAKAIYYQAVTA